jgi:hypothetical protein
LQALLNKNGTCNTIWNAHEKMNSLSSRVKDAEIKRKRKKENRPISMSISLVFLPFLKTPRLH